MSSVWRNAAPDLACLDRLNRAGASPNEVQPFSSHRRARLPGTADDGDRAAVRVRKECIRSPAAQLHAGRNGQWAHRLRIGARRRASDDYCEPERQELHIWTDAGLRVDLRGDGADATAGTGVLGDRRKRCRRHRQCGQCGRRVLRAGAQRGRDGERTHRFRIGARHGQRDTQRRRGRHRVRVYHAGCRWQHLYGDGQNATRRTGVCGHQGHRHHGRGQCQFRGGQLHR